MYLCCIFLVNGKINELNRTFVLILKVRMGTEVYEAPSDENLVRNSVKWFISS